MTATLGRGRWGGSWGGESPLPTLRLAVRGRPLLTGVLAVMVVIDALSALAVMAAAAVVVGSSPEALSDGISSDAGRRLLLAFVAVALLFTLQHIVSPTRGALSDLIATWLQRETQRRVMQATTTPTGVAHLQDHAILDKIATARGAGPFEIHAGLVVVGGAQVARQWLQGLGAAVIVAAIQPLAGIVLLLVTVNLRRTMEPLIARANEARIGHVAQLRRTAYFRELALAPTAAKELRVFGLQQWLGDTFHELWVGAMQEAWRRRAQGWGGLLAALALMGLGYGGAAYLLGSAALSGTLSLTEITLFAQALFTVGSLTHVSTADYLLGTGSHSVPALEDLEHKLVPPAVGGLSAERLPKVGIRFEGVTFTYPGGSRPVLQRLDLEIPAGRSLAIVGSNGAGKTTLVCLLARLFEPDEGRITVDGVDVRELDPAQWQKRIAAIFQDFVHYELSARDNVGFEAVDSEALQRAAARAGVTDVVADLPAGWDTVLSRHYPEGVELSGGQWQRVGLARALYAVERGAGVLVLDEPTANLDVRAEAELYRRFLELTRGLTTILVAHRFSTVRQADRIVVLDEGRVAEDGTHTRLLAANGRYASMFRAQAGMYAGGTGEAADA